MNDIAALMDDFHYLEIRSRRIPGRDAVEWVVGVQAKRGGRVFRVTSIDLQEAVQEASRMAVSELARLEVKRD